MFNKFAIGDIVTLPNTILQIGKVVNIIDDKTFSLIVEFIGDESGERQIQRKFNSKGILQYSINGNMLEKIKLPYLIQEAIQRNNETMSKSEGIDKYSVFKYMGRVEYEWGVKNKSLTRIRRDIVEYSTKNIRLSNYISNKNKEKPIMISVLCKAEEIQKIEYFISELAKNNLVLKEPINFHDKLLGINNRFDKENFYWDLENDFMFWFTGEGRWGKQFLNSIDSNKKW